MYCPICGQQQISEETRFCSRCGFLLTGVAEVVAKGGALPQFINQTDPKAMSPRRKGVKQGGRLMLAGLIIVPLVAVLSEALNFDPTLTAILAILTFWGGLLRIIYALLFESSQPIGKTLEENLLSNAQTLFGRNKKQNALPPHQSIPASDYIPPTQTNRRDTNDLAQPSVTEETTKLLEKDSERQK